MNRLCEIHCAIFIAKEYFIKVIHRLRQRLCRHCVLSTVALPKRNLAAYISGGQVVFAIRASNIE